MLNKLLLEALICILCINMHVMMHNISEWQKFLLEKSSQAMWRNLCNPNGLMVAMLANIWNTKKTVYRRKCRRRTRPEFSMVMKVKLELTCQNICKLWDNKISSSSHFLLHILSSKLLFCKWNKEMSKRRGAKIILICKVEVQFFANSLHVIFNC